MLETQLKEVEAKIQAACDRAGRKREEVTLIAEIGRASCRERV